MNIVTTVGIVLLVFSGASMGLFIAYPLLLRCAYRLLPVRAHQTADIRPSVTVLIAVHNGADLVEAKVANSLALEYRRDRMQVLFVSDGSTDATVELLRACKDDRVEVLERDEHQGKIAALNYAMPRCRGDVVVFSDVDALLAPDALRMLLRHFDDPAVGGVCGQRVIPDDAVWSGSGQASYVAVDTKLKSLETRMGSVTSNDGKLYAVRRDLCRPMPEAVTDDLFMCLSIVSKGHRFVFDEDARARVLLPSRSWRHEFHRRRRIVSTSLRGIYYERGLLNPFVFGRYSLQLLINKITRRMLPFHMLGVLVGMGILAAVWPVLYIPLGLVIAGLVAGVLWPAGIRMPAPLRPLGAVADAAHYLCLGSIGTLCGVIDFMFGRRITGWEPNKGA